MGSFCISTMRITLCLAPELKATPCWDGVYLEERQEGRNVSPRTQLYLQPHAQVTVCTYVCKRFITLCVSSCSSLLSTPHDVNVVCPHDNAYLMYCAGACLSAALTGMAAAIFWDTCLSRAARVFSVSYRGRTMTTMLRCRLTLFKFNSGKKRIKYYETLYII